MGGQPDGALARLARADLALDCFSYGADTTASDLLWAGVPLVGLAGGTFVSRVSASILGAAGLADHVTGSLQDYHDLALRLARDPAALTRARERAAASRRTPLFDTAGFTRNLEAAFRAIVARQRAGLAPDHLTIAEAPASRGARRTARRPEPARPFGWWWFSRWRAPQSRPAARHRDGDPTSRHRPPRRGAHTAACRTADASRGWRRAWP